MSRMLGTVSMGVRAPIIREGDDLAKIVTGSILDAIREYGLTPTGIRYILKERGIDTARPTLVEQPQTLEQ